MITFSLAWGRWLCGFGVVLCVFSAMFGNATPWTILAGGFLLSAVALHGIAVWKAVAEAHLRLERAPAPAAVEDDYP